MIEDFLTEAQAAELLGVSPSTLNLWRTRKMRRGPAYIKYGKIVRYRVEDLEEFIKNSIIQPTQQQRIRSEAQL